MNPFQRARDEAKATRAKLAPGKVGVAIKARDLLGAIESELGIAVEPVEPSYPDLGQGSAVGPRGPAGDNGRRPRDSTGAGRAWPAA